MCYACNVREGWRLNAPARNTTNHTLVCLFLFTPSYLFIYNTPRRSLQPHLCIIHLSCFLLLARFLKGDSDGEGENEAAISSHVCCIALPMLTDSCHVCCRLWGSEELLLYRPQHGHTSHRFISHTQSSPVIFGPCASIKIVSLIFYHIIRS